MCHARHNYCLIFFFTVIMWDCHAYCFFFTDEDNEAQRDDVTCEEAVDPGLEPAHSACDLSMCSSSPGLLKGQKPFAYWSDSLYCLTLGLLCWALPSLEGLFWKLDSSSLWPLPDLVAGLVGGFHIWAPVSLEGELLKSTGCVLLTFKRATAW